ncbi:MAG: hypothetical protein ACUVR8_10990 [Acidobacteriota bacterium]
MSVPKTPEALTPATDTPGSVAEEVAPVVSQATDAADALREEETFKQLIRDFVLGNNQHPDDMPGLRFYVVFAGMLALALLGVGVVALLLGFIHWVRAFLH